MKKNIAFVLMLLLAAMCYTACAANGKKQQFAVKSYVPMPVGWWYEIPDEENYNSEKATNKRSFTDGKGIGMDFQITGTLYNIGTKNGYTAYIAAENDVVLRFDINKDFFQKSASRGWTVSNDLDSFQFGGDPTSYGEGSIIIRMSKDGRNWVVSDICNDVLSSPDTAWHSDLYAMQLDGGCYFSVEFCYEMKQKKENSHWYESPYNYKNYSEKFSFYIESAEPAVFDPAEKQYTIGKKERTNSNFYGSSVIGPNDSHYGWDLGRFFITGFTDQEDAGGNPVFLKNVGDEISLWFNLQQDIDALNGNPNRKIKADKKVTDQNFELPKTNFYRGTLIVRYTDYQNIAHTPVVYTNFLQACSSQYANTHIELFEEGDYEVALDYSLGSFDHYHIAFRFSVRNSNCMVFPIDIATGWELVNSSYTDNGFYLDLSRSRYLDINVKRIDRSSGNDDIRFNRSAKDGEAYTDEGEYIITVKNKVTGEQTEKRIYVGSNYRKYASN